MVKASTQWKKVLENVLHDVDLSEADWRVLTAARQMGDGVYQVTLAKHVGVETPTLVRLLDRLSKAGLVVRATDPTNRRANAVSVTAAGHSACILVENRIGEARANVLGSVDARDLETTLRVLGSFAEQRAIASSPISGSDIDGNVPSQAVVTAAKSED